MSVCLSVCLSVCICVCACVSVPVWVWAWVGVCLSAYHTNLSAGAATHSPAFGGKFAVACLLLLLTFATAISAFTYAVSFLFSSAKSVLKYISTIMLFATTLPLTFLFSLAVVLPNTAHAAALLLSVFPGLAVSWGLFQVHACGRAGVWACGRVGV